jgi:hypothetical protein
VIDIVIDLETLGTRPGCVILEIGACAIDPRNGKIVANFSRRLDSDFTYNSLINNDRYLSDDEVATVRWWLGDQERADTLLSLLSGYATATPIEKALGNFADFYNCMVTAHTPEGVRIWANGPSFDIAILQAAYDRYGIARPWICWQERCVRTALEMAGYERGSIGWIERGPRHRALNDARHEARKLFYSGALGEVSAIIKRLHQTGTLKGGQS